METDRPGSENLSPQAGLRARAVQETDRTGEGGSTLGGLDFTIFFLESFNPSGGIQQFLFAGEERMTAGTDLNTDLFLSAYRLKRRSAGAFDDRIKDLGMNLLFHASNLQLQL